MKHWEEGNITNLVREGRAIQNCIPNHQWKTHGTLQLPTETGKGGVLQLHDTINNGDSEQIKDVLKSKYPPGQVATTDYI